MKKFIEYFNSPQNEENASRISKLSFNSSFSFDLKSIYENETALSVMSNEPISFKKIKILLILWLFLTIVIIGLSIYRFFIDVPYQLMDT